MPALLNHLSVPAQSEAASGGIDRQRRSLVFGAAATAGAVALGFSPAQAAVRRPSLRSGIDRSVRVSAARLDAEVAKAFPLFNAPAILPQFDAATAGARVDVDLHRIVTTTRVPETGERLKVSGLLAVPAG